MMEVYVDDVPVEFRDENAGSLEEAIRTIQRGFGDREQMVVGLRCNGKEVNAAEMAEVLRSTPADHERIDIITGTRAELVADAMNQASACLTNTEEACRQAAEHFSQGNTDEGSQTLASCLQVWQQVHDAVAKSLAILEVDADRIEVGGMQLTDLFERPKQVLLDVRTALTSRDYVMLADLLQYEFPDVTSKWHELVLYLRQSASPGDP